MFVLEFISIFFYLTACFIETTSSSSSFQPPINLNNSALQKNEPKIIGGYPATHDGTEHLVSIRWKSIERGRGFGYGHICGGSVIDSSIILTAAHCFLDQSKGDGSMHKASQFVVVMGTLNKYRKTKDTLVFNVKRYHAHAKFSINTLANDIATIIIDGVIPENHDKVQRIPLTDKRLEIGQKCRVDGWGVLEYREQNQPQLLPDVLMTANIEILDLKRCKLAYNNQLRKGMICAGKWSGGIDSCAGDSGGPLASSGSLVGIVSWGDKCAFRNSPGIYTDVYNYLDWISKNSVDRLAIKTNIIIFAISLVILSVKIIL